MKVLSIDFDYIMFPCISLYNDMVNGDANSTQLWTQMEFERKLKEFLTYDANAYNYIMQACVKNVCNNATIVPITSHEEIVKFLENECSDEIVTGNCVLDNIDFHHDIFYQKSDLSRIYNFADKSCANWAGYLLCQGYIEKYSWFDAPHSTPFSLNNFFDAAEFETEPVRELQVLFENKYENKHFKDLANLNDDYDIVFLCLSPQWVPYQYHHLYDLILNTCKSINAERVWRNKS